MLRPVNGPQALDRGRKHKARCDGAAEVGGHTFGRRPVDVGDDNRRTFLRHQPRRGLADAGSRHPVTMATLPSRRPIDRE
jgi:hypothetical protein